MGDTRRRIWGSLGGLLLAMAWAAASAALAAPLEAGSDPAALPGGIVARGGAVEEAWLIAPTDRYRHFVRGNSVEAGGLRVRLRDGTVLTHLLAEDEVFEDAGPRLADLDADGIEEIVVVLSSLTLGGALAVYAVDAGDLALLARTPFIGTAHRWLNPAGIADFDGDGRVEIAVVQMPHLQRRLELWRLSDGRLARLSAVEDVSNHRLGSPHTGMSAVADFDGDGIADLAVPSGDRLSIRVLSFVHGAREIDRLALPAPADGDLRLIEGALLVPLENGEQFRIRPGG